jgi:trk system potassium uptake protein TrkH
MLNGLFMLSAIIFSILYQGNDVQAFLISGIGTILIGFILWLTYRNEKGSEITKKEGYFIVTLGWLVMSLFGALPFIIHGAIPNYTDAFFETMSGFTTTGASILVDIEKLPAGLIFWRSLTQWLGGMGIIVLSIAILPILGIGGMQLFVAEVPGVTKDKFHPRVRETAKRLWGIYVMLTLAETILLFIGGMSFFDAINHSLTTMATGGFSPKNASIAAYTSPFIHYVLIFFMFLAGTNFTLHYFALHGKFDFLKTNNEFRFYAMFILIFTVMVALVHLPHVSFHFEEAFRQALFHVVSLVTTTGYVSSDYENWAPFSKTVFFVLLFIGGCSGSTGGSIKVIRHYVLYKNSLLELKRLIHPRAVIPVRVNNKTVPPEIVLNVQAFLLFYIVIFIFGSMLLSLLGLNFDSALGAVATCLGNVGPGFGTVGPVSNFSQVPDVGKWILSFFMLLGRLELFTVLMIFTISFWKE